MPLQNKIHGVVIETLDAILSSSFDVPRQVLDKALGRPRIIGDLDLPIRHCLVVRKGVRMEDIRWIRSHEQVSSRRRWYSQTTNDRRWASRRDSYGNGYPLPRYKTGLQQQVQRYHSLTRQGKRGKEPQFARKPSWDYIRSS